MSNQSRNKKIKKHSEETTNVESLPHEQKKVGWIQRAQKRGSDKGEGILTGQSYTRKTANERVRGDGDQEMRRARR